MSSLPNPPSLIEYKNWKFLIFNAPTDANIDLYIKEFKEVGVKHVVRACDPSYSTETLSREGITVHEMTFPDGGAPSDDVVKQWLSLLRQLSKENESKDIAVGIHCVAGLGRAPVLVAIFLLELGMRYEEAVDLIRKKRRGAINAKQLKFLKSYKPHRDKCNIM